MAAAAGVTTTALESYERALAVPHPAVLRHVLCECEKAIRYGVDSHDPAGDADLQDFWLSLSAEQRVAVKPTMTELEALLSTAA